MAPPTAAQKTALTIILGAIVTLAPAFLTYCSARQEIQEKYAQNRREDDAGYTALAATVKDLQKSVLEQHDYIVKLEGQLTLLASLLTRMAQAEVDVGVGSGSGSGSAGTVRLTGMTGGGSTGRVHISSVPITSVPHFPAPPERPELRPPPGDLDTAIKEADAAAD